ncbi:response regulator [Sphingomonas japonica]|uniref:Two-component system nitrate/nitrite response regulator NarP n=1 Tax=Sphingomonas japonica TaxID=511662 RepID=A0ABX0U1B3_9SPHN|nr:response regulator transcription factor [Sphingomonas japonica]NIJ23157.1 two-component system nitrate/nitrite response regulator NarP [Sphingomonas japonica]
MIDDHRALPDPVEVARVEQAQPVPAPGGMQRPVPRTYPCRKAATLAGRAINRYRCVSSCAIAALEAAKIGMTKVLIAEDDPLTLSGIEMLLENSNFQVVASVRTGTAALEKLATARPEMLILDNGMPERSGLDVLRTIRSRGDDRPVVLLTGSINDQTSKEALQLAVNGLVIKTTAPRDLLVCLETVVQGRRWIDQEVMQRAMDMAMAPDAVRDPMDGLSSRERAVAALVQRGLRNKEIASELGLTEGTVKVHLHKIFDKLDVRSRTELILFVQERES